MNDDAVDYEPGINLAPLIAVERAVRLLQRRNKLGRTIGDLEHPDPEVVLVSSDDRQTWTREQSFKRYPAARARSVRARVHPE